MALSSILDQSRKSLGHVYDAGQLDWVPATASSGGGDGVILDGVSSSIKATVFDFTNSNPLAVTLRDTNGDAVSVGGGTQYTEDAAAAANPIGTAVNLVRQDTPTGLVSTDGDNVTQRGTNFGAGFVQVLTSAGAFVDTFGGGTQYTEDAASAANPVGTAVNLVRSDTPTSGLVSTDGDNVAQRGTNFGASYVSVIDRIDGSDIDFASNANLQLIIDQLTPAATAIAKAEDAASVTGDVGVPAMAIQRATPANTAADLDYSMLQMSAGRLWASATIDAAIPAGSNIIGALVADQTVNLNKIVGTAADVNSGLKSAGTLRVVLATDQPALTNKLLVTPDSVALPANQSVNISQINAVTPLMGAGNTGTGSLRVTIATDQATVPVSLASVPSHAVTNAGTFVVQENGSQVIVDDTAFTPATTKVVMSGLQADETATDSVDEGDAGAARMTLDRKAIVTPQPHTQGGLSSYTALSTAAVLTAQIKGSVGQVYDIEMFNTGTGAVFARLYDQTGAPASTDGANIIWRGVIPGTSGSTGAGFVKASVHGRAHATGIGIRVTGAVADNDTTALSANQVLVNVGYK